MNTYSVASTVLGAFICNTLFSHPAHSNPARKASTSCVLVTTVKADVVRGASGVPDKHPPMDSTVLSAKHSFTLECL